MERAIIANRKHDKGEVRKEMSERKMKRVEDSLTEQSHLLMPKCLNAAGYLFGGQLLAWIDETAGIVAKRHAEMNVVTVAVDNMYFKAGARVHDTSFSSDGLHMWDVLPWKYVLILTVKPLMEPEP